MKIALVINDEYGFEFCKFLHEFGADVIVFTEKQEINSKVNEFAYKIISTNPKWVQKKTQSIEYNMSNIERMRDNFRVVYGKKNLIEANNPFAKNFINSLEDEFDVYEDVDGVFVLIQGCQKTNKTHPSFAYALGEQKYLDILSKKNQLFYMPKEKDINLPETGDIALVGTEEIPDSTLSSYFLWLINGIRDKKQRRIFWITNKSNPWAHVNQKLKDQFYNELKIQFEEKIKKFLEDKKVWDQLEDYVKVKIKKPVEPLPDLVLFAGHILHSIDVLVNSDEVYLTLESLGEKFCSVQIENSIQEIKTISVKQLYVHHGLQNNVAFQTYLRNDEPGFICYDPRYWSQDAMKIDFVQKFVPYFRRS